MKVSGRKVADVISKKLQQEVSKLAQKPTLAIILAGDDPSSRIYVNNKIKRAAEVGINTKLLEFSHKQFDDVLEAVWELNKDKSINGIIIQYPTYKDWDFEKLVSYVDPKKDVDGFLPNSFFKGATALGVWEMLTAFAFEEGFSKTEEFLKNKNIVLLGKGKTAGGPTRDLLTEKGIEFNLIDSKTENPEELIKNADIVISATGRKNIITGDKIKEGSFVIGVGVGKEKIDSEEKIYGDIEESTVSEKAKLYSPTIGGIGPLTIVSLLKNTIEASKKTKSV